MTFIYKGITFTIRLRSDNNDHIWGYTDQKIKTMFEGEINKPFSYDVKKDEKGFYLYPLGRYAFYEKHYLDAKELESVKILNDLA